MKLVASNPKNQQLQQGERRYLIGAMVGEDEIADLTPSILPPGATRSEFPMVLASA